MSHRSLGDELRGKNGAFNQTVLMMQPDFGPFQRENPGLHAASWGSLSTGGPCQPWRAQTRDIQVSSCFPHPHHITQRAQAPGAQQSCGMIWCEGESRCGRQGCCSLAGFISAARVLNSKAEVPTAARKTHSHVQKHLLDTSAASLSTKRGV